MTSNNLCNSCINVCEFQSGIVRTKCAFYIPPQIEPPKMTLEENIKAILECNFSIAKDEVIEAVTKRIMEQISRQKDELLKGDIDGQ